jgi:hypothetical protein
MVTVIQPYQVQYDKAKHNNYIVVTSMKNSGISDRIYPTSPDYNKGLEIYNLFCRRLRDAVDKGYYINGIFFRHEDGRVIHYSHALDPSSDFESLLETGEDIMMNVYKV